jgi:hypothetical protein
MKTVKFIWTPGHAGISGNKKADKGAKEALRQVVAADMITRAKLNAKKIIEQTWQQSQSPMTRLKKLLKDENIENQMWS